MDHRLSPARRIRHLLLAAGLGLSMLGAMPWAAAAADESATPTPAVTPAPTPSPDPTTAPVDTQASTPPATETQPPDPAPTPPPDPTPTPPPDPTPTPAPTPTRGATPRPTPVITSVNLYRSGAMVRQYTSYWCVPAATQSMLNLALGTSNRRYLTQKYFYARIREHNRYRYITRGNDPQGWAWGLRRFSGLRTMYAAKMYSDRQQAINAIVESIARTGDPVGITVRKGTHAWVVLGYRTSHDPIEPTKKTVLGFYVSGPLGTTADKWPYAYLTVSQFNTYFTRYHEWQRKVIWEGKWVIIAQ
jgi:hypothetical protein